MAHERRRSVLLASGVFLGCLVAYCAVQTFLNPISVDLQDYVLIALPVVAAIVMWLTLSLSPPMPFWWRPAFGFIGGMVFSYGYFAWFKLVIIDQLHSWQRNESLYLDLASVLGLLGVAAGVIGAITGALSLRPKVKA